MLLCVLISGCHEFICAICISWSFADAVSHMMKYFYVHAITFVVYGGFEMPPVCQGVYVSGILNSCGCIFNRFEEGVTLVQGTAN